MTDQITPAAAAMVETQGWRKRANAGKAKLARNAQMAELRAIRAAHIASMEAPAEAPVAEQQDAAQDDSTENPAPAAKTGRKKAAADKAQ